MNPTDSFSTDLPERNIDNGSTNWMHVCDDWDFNDYEEGARIRIDPNAISASFMILEDENQNEALDGRVYEKYGQNLTRAAVALGVSRNTVRKYL